MPGLPSGVSADTVEAEYAVYADTLLPASLDVSVTSSSLGSLGVQLTFGDYGRPVTISAPPANEIEP